MQFICETISATDVRDDYISNLAVIRRSPQLYSFQFTYLLHVSVTDEQ